MHIYAVTTVIAVSAGGATVVIGLLIVLVLLTALLMKAKSKRNGESTSRTGTYDIWLFALVWTLIYNNIIILSLFIKRWLQ